MSSTSSQTTIMTPLLDKQSEWLPLIFFGIICTVIFLLASMVWILVEYCCRRFYSEYPDALDPIQPTIEDNRYTSAESYGQVY